MISLRWSFVYVFIIIFTEFSMASADDNIDKKVTNLFEINWESMRYGKSVSLYNPKVSPNQQASRKLKVSGTFLRMSRALFGGPFQLTIYY